MKKRTFYVAYIGRTDCGHAHLTATAAARCLIRSMRALPGGPRKWDSGQVMRQWGTRADAETVELTESEHIKIALEILPEITRELVR